MYMIIIEAPIDTFAYGPFTAPEEAYAWGDRVAPILPSAGHRIAFCEVNAPFDITGEVPTAARSAGPAVHRGQGGDHQATDFLVVLTDQDDNGGAVVGTFSARDSAVEWWDTQRPTMEHGVCATVLPIVAPHDLLDEGRKAMSNDTIPVPQKINGYPVISAVPVEAGEGEFPHQWIVICDRGHQGYTADRRFTTWLVYWHPSFPNDRGSYQAHEGCYDLTREEADISLEQRTTGERKHLQYVAKDDQRRDGERS